MNTNAVCCMALAAGLYLVSAPLPVLAGDKALVKAVQSEQRPEDAKARDKYRHPVETLEFFGLRPDMTVVEIWPGDKTWYTDILIPYLRDDGKLIAATFGSDAANYDNERVVRIITNAREKFARKISEQAEVYGDLEVTELWAPHQTAIAAPGSVDMILTFRNLHNWIMWDQVDDVLASFYRALKPGGIVGMTDHRWPAQRPVDPGSANGYVSEARAINLMAKAGFEFVGRSDINSNPADTADHPAGVWSLPPTLALGDQDRDQYLAIGESDRFTLKFRKPE